MMKPHLFETTTIINRPLPEVFDFFSKAENLNLITPPGLDFRILTPSPVQIFKGALIDYKIKLHGISFKWRTEIAEWEPPFRFADHQLKGPYVKWHHTHVFKEINNGTEMMDHVEFLSPGWIFEPLVNALYVKKKVKEIFRHREVRLKEIFK